MEKIKNKKVLLIIAVVLIVIIGIVITINLLNKKMDNDSESKNNIEENEVNEENSSKYEDSDNENDVNIDVTEDSEISCDDHFVYPYVWWSDIKIKAVDENNQNSNVTDIDINSDEVQNILRYLSNINDACLQIYGDNGKTLYETSPRDFYLTVALSNTNEKECRDVYTSDVYPNSEMCFNAEEFISKYEEIFDKKITVNEHTFDFVDVCYAYVYSKENNEFYSFSGAGVTEEYLRKFYKAEIENDNMYIYEVVVDEYGKYFYNDDNAKFLKKCGYIYFANNKTIGFNEILTTENIVNYKDYLEKYKWTFTKNEDGKYILKSFKKI